MPLAFASRSHGTIAFGFFNIEIDVLLLESRFFFADRFCAAMIESATSGQATLDGWRIDDPARVGNLHAAIAGQDCSGFIGACYARWPFPQNPEEFKQSPDGAVHQPVVAAMIEHFGVAEPMLVRWPDASGVMGIGEYLFDRDGLAELVGYVERGGYPRWRDEQGPGYVTAMVAQLRALEGNGVIL